MAGGGVRVTGHDVLERRLARLAAGVPDRVARALYQEAEIEMTEAKRRTPVDTGALRSSGVVELPVLRGRLIEVVMGFGGPAAAYAVAVHENLEAFHPTGQAKFLESTLNESVPFLANRIGARLDLEELASR